MLTIRLRRVGKTNRPAFKIVVADKRFSAAAGKFREEVGWLDRIGKQCKINKERVVYWISKGAQPSPAVNNLLVAQKIVNGKKIAVHAQSKKDQKAAVAAPAAK